MRRFATPLVLAVAMGVIAAACGSIDASSDDDTLPPPATSDDLVGAWQLVAGTVGGAAIPSVEGFRITLAYDGELARGTAACNEYGGRLRIIDPADGRVTIDELSWTERACLPEVMTAEQLYLGALPAITHADVSGDELTLRGTDVELRFQRLAPVATAELVGTTWVLETLTIRDAAVSAAPDAPATLELDDDGSMSGTTGCRDISGRYEIVGDEVRFLELGAVDLGCPDRLAEQDGQVISVLESGFTVAIDGDVLTLSSEGNEGLVYRAVD